MLHDTKGRPWSFTEWGEVLAYVEGRLGRQLSGKEDVARFNAFYDAYAERKYGSAPSIEEPKP